MVPRSTPQVALLLFHRAIGHAYSQVTSLGWHGWLTEGEIRRIENDAIAMINDSKSPERDPARLRPGSSHRRRDTVGAAVLHHDPQRALKAADRQSVTRPGAPYRPAP